VWGLNVGSIIINAAEMQGIKNRRWVCKHLQVNMLQTFVSCLITAASPHKWCDLSTGMVDGIRGWCGRCDGWSHETSEEWNCQGKIKPTSKMLTNTVSHPHIVTVANMLKAPWRWDVMKVGGEQCSQWRGEAVATMAMWWWVTNKSLICQLTIAHLVTSAHHCQGYCCVT
jgi:hypothetical protein